MSSSTAHTTTPAATTLSAAQLRGSLDLFQLWLSEHGHASHDPYSLWSTSFGIRAKAVFQRNPVLGAVMVSPIFLADILVPGLTRRALTPKRFPIADAHCIMALCTLYEQNGDQRLLHQAEELATELLQQSLHETHSGHCWGYPFDWMSKQGLWRSKTPLITSTPYGFEALLQLFDLTQKAEYAEAAQSVARFALNDLNETAMSTHSVACSYSPIDHSKVINANAYRAMVLTETWRRFGSSTIIDAAKRNINFVMESQLADGSWWYAMGHESDRFVDNFHTCLVLKNLIKINRTLGFPELWSCIARGVEYYLKNLLDDHGRPKPYAVSSRIPLVSAEMYDYAEGITLGVLMQRHFPPSIETNRLRERIAASTLHVADTLIREFQLSDGHFVTKVHFGLIRNTTPYIRWPQAQIFYALSHLSQSFDLFDDSTARTHSMTSRSLW